MQFYTVAAKNLFRRKIRTFFTLLGIASAVGAFIALIGLSRGFENAWSEALLERDTHIFCVPAGVIDILSASIDEDSGTEMAKIPGVIEVSGELVDMVDLDTGEMIIVAGWPVGSYLWNSVDLQDGRVPGETGSYEIVLGEDLAASLEVQVGDALDVRAMSFTVSGISAGGGVMRNHAMVMTLDALQELNNREGKVSTLNFQIENYGDGDKAAGILADLRENFPDFRFTEALDIGANNRILDLFRAMAWGTSVIALFIGLVVILNTLLMSVMERTREFGLLSAVGWSGLRIVGLVVLEGLFLSLLGSLLGILMGVGGLRLIADSKYMSGLIQPAISSTLFLEVLAATLILGLFGSIYPAWRSITLSPTEALRHE